MAEEENKIDIFGRKIFFLNPAYTVKNEIIKDLQNHEYEVYIIDNYHDAKSVLRHNPDSILFVNVDAQLSTKAWYNFIRSFEKDALLKTIYVGIISERIKQTDADLFSKAPEVQGGVILLDSGYETITRNINKILTDTNAKGKRQYVRANMSYDKDSSLFWNIGNKMYQLKLLDLSSVGMSVVVPASFTEEVEKNTLLRDVTLRLGTKQLVVEAVVFATKKEENRTIWILLLLPNTSNVVRDTIRNYVSQRNQRVLMTSINDDRIDDNDYGKLNYYDLATMQKNKVQSQSLSFTHHQPGYNNN